MKENEELLKRIKKDLPRFFGTDEEKSFKGNVIENMLLELEGDKERNHMILVLAKNRKLWKWIDKIYDVRKHEYYRCYKETFFSTTPLKEVYSTKTKEYINKMSGIDKWCRDNATEEPILKIIQKEHNKLYSRFKVGIKEFDLDKFIAKKLSNIEKETKDRNHILLDKHNQLEEIIAITLYLSVIYNVEITGFLWKKVMDGYMGDLFSGVRAKIASTMFLNDIGKDKIRELVKAILEVEYHKLEDCQNLDDFYNLMAVEQSTIARKTMSIMCNVDMDPANIDIGKEIVNTILKGDLPPLFDTNELASKLIERSSKEYVSKINNTEMSNMIALLINMSRTTGLDKEALIDIPLNMDIIEAGILVSFEDDIEEYLNNQKNIDKTLRLKVLSAITIMSLFESYKSTTPHSFGQEEEATLLEIEQLNKTIKDKDDEIALLKEKLDSLAKSKNQHIKEILDESDLLKKNVKRLKKEVDIAKENQVEFVAMKEYIYRNSIREDELAVSMKDDDISIEDKISYLNDKKIAIFGGHPNWVNKLKKLLPEARYIDTNACSSRKFNRLDKYDLLVICNLFISHGLSWRVSEAIKNVKSKKVIIIDDINTDLIINNIYGAIKQYEGKEMSN